MSPTTKSQLSVEFVIVIFFAILLFSFTLYAYFQQSVSVNAQKELFEAKEIVQKFVLNANLAYLDSSTCGNTFYVPITIRERSYALTHLANSHLLSITWDKSYYSFPLLSSDISINSSVKNSYFVNCTGGISIE